MSFLKSAGEPASTVPPMSATRALILGSARPSLISWLSLSMISAGVFLGAPTPCNTAVSYPGTKSAHHREVRQHLRTPCTCHRQWPKFAGPDILDGCRHGAEHRVHVASKHISQCRCFAPIRNVHQLRPVIILNSSPERWPAVPLPPEATLTLPGLVLA